MSSPCFIRRGALLIRRLSVLAGILCLAGAASPAAARERRAFAGGRVGYLKVADIDRGSLNIGLLGGYYFAPRVALEGSLDYHTPDFDLYQRSTYALQVSAYVYPFTAKHVFRPYAVGGVGFYTSSYEYDPSLIPTPDDERRSIGGFHAGLGFDVRLGTPVDPGDMQGPIALTVDFRYLFTKDDPTGTKADGWLGTLGLRVGF